LEAGDYTIKYSYHYAGHEIDTNEIGFCDIYSKLGSIDSAKYKHVIIKESQSVSFDFSLKENCTDFEVRVYSYQKGLVLDSVEIVKH